MKTHLKTHQVTQVVRHIDNIMDTSPSKPKTQNNLSIKQRQQLEEYRRNEHTSPTKESKQSYQHEHQDQVQKTKVNQRNNGN